MRIKTHPLSVTHLVVGLVFLGIAGSWALRQANLIEADDVTWLFPVALVIAGGVGLVAAMAKGVRGSRKPTPELRSEYVEQTPYDAPPRPDYTSDIDRKLSDAERSGSTTGSEVDDTAVIATTETDSPTETKTENKENDR